jgi:hypothetical protein
MMADPYTDFGITPNNEVHRVQQTVANTNLGTGSSESEGETQSLQQAGIPLVDHQTTSTPAVRHERFGTETARQSSVHVDQRERVAILAIWR